MNTYYAFAVFSSAFFALSLVVTLSSTIAINKKSKLGFGAMFMLLALVNLAEFGAASINDLNKYKVWFYILKTFEMSFSTLIPFSAIMGITNGKLNKISLSLTGIDFLLLLISIFTGIIFKLEDGIYKRGSFYYGQTVIYIVSFVLLVIECVKLNLKYQINNIYTLVMSSILGLAGILLPLDPINKRVRLDWCFITLAACLLYEFYAQLQNQTDELTNVGNRKSYENYSKSIKKKKVLVIFDINNFKEINDMHGHVYGDECLVKIAKNIKISSGKGSKVFRIGGDEFVSFIPYNAFNEKEFISSFTLLNEKCREEDSRFSACSFGSVIYDPEHNSFIEKLSEADALMYKNKESYKVI